MAVPFRTTYVTLGGLQLRSKAIESFDWRELLRDAPKDGQNRKLPGIDHVEVQPRTLGEIRTFFEVRVSGEYTQLNAAVVRNDWRSMFYTNLAALRVRTRVKTVQTLTLVTPHASYSADCQVEDGGTPRFLNPWTAELVIDVTLPSGALL